MPMSFALPYMQVHVLAFLTSGTPFLNHVISGAGLPLAEQVSTIFPCSLASRSFGGASTILRNPLLLRPLLRLATCVSESEMSAYKRARKYMG